MLVLTLLLLVRSRFPATLVLLVIGAALALVEQPTLAGELATIHLSPRLPTLVWPTLSWHDLWIGALYLALPQLPLTFGNALISISEENNRLFPDRPVTERRVAPSTGLMNLWSSALGGIPMCHGAGGMAGHVRFGTHTGGASILLGGLLLAIGLFLGDSVAMLFRLFPPAVLGVILFLAGMQLALNGRALGLDKLERHIVLITAAFAIWNVGIAVLAGIAAYHAAKRGWLFLS
jgi:MFS superfamily sulfate permease-like transporter